MSGLFFSIFIVCVNRILFSFSNATESKNVLFKILFCICGCWDYCSLIPLTSLSHANIILCFSLFRAEKKFLVAEAQALRLQFNTALADKDRRIAELHKHQEIAVIGSVLHGGKVGLKSLFRLFDILIPAYYFTYFYILKSQRQKLEKISSTEIQQKILM